MFKTRTKFGKFVDKHLGYGGQERISEESGLNRNTVSRACNDLDYVPRKSVQKLLIDAVKKLTNIEIDNTKFWL